MLQADKFVLFSFSIEYSNCCFISETMRSAGFHGVIDSLTDNLLQTF